MHCQLIMGSMLIFITTTGVFSGFTDVFAGEYDIVLHEVGKCRNEGTGAVKFSTRLTRVNRTLVTYSSNFTLPVDYDDRLQLQIDFATWGNGGWKWIYNLRLKNACREARRLAPELITRIVKSAGTNYTTCPVPKGNYYLKDINPNVHLSLPRIPYNKYRAEQAFITANQRRIGCVMVIFEIIPQRKNNRHK